MSICIFRCPACKGQEFERRNVRLDRTEFCRECGEQLENVSVGGDLEKGKRSTGPY